MVKLSHEAVARGLKEMTRLHAGYRPTAQELAEAPILSGWLLQEIGNGLHRLGGVVSGHPILAPGWCWTSVVVFMAPDKTWARTISRYYRLEKPFSIDQA